MDKPRFSVGQYTTPGLSFAEDLRVYEQAGAEGVGIDVGLKVRDWTEDLARFRESPLEATYCFPSTSGVYFGTMARGARDPQARIEEICDGVRALAPFEPICVSCGPGPAPDHEAWKIAAAGLKRVARVAAELGMRIALEPLHSSMAPEWTCLTTIPQTIDMLDAIDEPNAGIIFDVWHLWDTPDLLHHIRDHASRFTGVHVNDHRDPTRSWCDRVLPGDGIAAIADIFGALDDGGYEGWLELEVFSDDGRYVEDYPDSLWRLDPVELISDGRRKTLELWEGRTASAAG